MKALDEMEFAVIQAASVVKPCVFIPARGKAKNQWLENAYSIKYFKYISRVSVHFIRFGFVRKDLVTALNKTFAQFFAMQQCRMDIERTIKLT